MISPGTPSEIPLGVSSEIPADHLGISPEVHSRIFSYVPNRSSPGVYYGTSRLVLFYA